MAEDINNNTYSQDSSVSLLDRQREMARLSEVGLIPTAPRAPYYLSKSLAAPADFSFLKHLSGKAKDRWLPELDEQGKPIIEKAPMIIDHKGKQCYFSRSENILLEYLCFLLSQRFNEPNTKAYAEAVNRELENKELANFAIPHIWIDTEDIAKVLLGRGTTEEIIAISSDLKRIADREQYIGWKNKEGKECGASQKLILLDDFITEYPENVKKNSKRGRKKKASEAKQLELHFPHYEEEKVILGCNVFFKSRAFYLRFNNFFCPIKPNLFDILRTEAATRKDIFMPLYNTLKVQFPIHRANYYNAPLYEIKQPVNKGKPSYVMKTIIERAQEKALCYEELFTTIKSRLPLGKNGKPKYSSRGTAHRFKEDLKEAAEVLVKYGLLSEVNIKEDRAVFKFNINFEIRSEDIQITINADTIAAEESNITDTETK